MDKQREVVHKKRDKVHDLRRRVVEQENAFRASVGEFQALSREKDDLMHHLSLLQVRYEESKSTLERHEARVAMDGRHGANGAFERNMRREVQERKQACKDVEYQIKTTERLLSKADKSQHKAKEKYDDLQNKLTDANLELRNEQGRLLQIRYRGIAFDAL
ncbi:hypothetical protein GGR51DRAFT_554711 [Nemania sp. FL0031]|nr:hypothetical protein GGR51DRAFT_554711 [Nemania sp. FL0031]